MQFARFRFAALGRGHAGTNPSPSQTGRQLIPGFESGRVFHQVALRIEHHSVSTIQNRQRRKRLQARGSAIQRAAALQQALVRDGGQVRNLSL